MASTGPTPPDAVSHKPQLSSIHTALGELAHRVASIADKSEGNSPTEASPNGNPATDGESEYISSQLHAVERSLIEARRRLEGLIKGIDA